MEIKQNETSINHFRESHSILISGFKSRYKKRAAFIYGLIMAISLAVRFLPQEQYFTLNVSEWQFTTQSYNIFNFFFPIFAGYAIDYAGYHLAFLFLHICTILGCLVNLIFVFREENYFPRSIKNTELFVLSNIFLSFGSESISIICQGATIIYFLPSKTISYRANFFYGTFFLGLGFLQFILFIVNVQEILILDEYIIFRVKAVIVLFLYFASLYMTVTIIRKERNLFKYSLNMERDVSEPRWAPFLDGLNFYPYSFWQSFQRVFNFRLIIAGLVEGILQHYAFALYLKTVFPNETDPKKNNFNMTIIYIPFWLICGIILIFFLGDYIQRFNNRFLLILCGSILIFFSFLGQSLFDKNYNNDIFIFYLVVSILKVSHLIGYSFFMGGFYAHFPLLCNQQNLFISYGFLKSIHSLVDFFLNFFPNAILGSMVLFASIILILLLEFHERKNTSKPNSIKQMKEISSSDDKNDLSSNEQTTTKLVFSNNKYEEIYVGEKIEILD